MDKRTHYNAVTFAALCNALRSYPAPPVVYYILSTALPTHPTSLIRVANEGAMPLPYDLVCHPDQLRALQTALAGIAVLRPHSNPQWRQCIEQMLAWCDQMAVALPTKTAPYPQWLG
ncbi:MAG: hypothetical protein U0350_21385 [Caldilineaceae bacterium]